MSKKIFGTDGVRGRSNIAPMTPDILTKLAVAVARRFRNGDHRHVVVIGKDTRLSGYMIEPALAAGFVSMGLDVMLLGPVPTPAVSMLVPSLRADVGVMISASHNPHEDNGLKIFAPSGHKISREDEAFIEKYLEEDSHDHLVDAKDLGRAKRLEDSPGRYIEFVKATFPKGLSLNGLKIVVDCAHGAAYRVAPLVFWELGAEVISLGVTPDGTNINQKVGATAPQALQEAVLTHQADLGIALDGDADRLVMVDEKGKLIDGDQLMGLIATSWHRQDRLKSPCVVGTVMSNLGLKKYLESEGLTLLRASVGDRYVAELMAQKGCNVGGEQSGHIILSDYAHTGDGIMAALQVLAVLAPSDRPLSDIGHVFDPVPQILRNVPLAVEGALQNKQVQEAILAGEEVLGSEGHLLVRKSGTEPLLRLMAQGNDTALVSRVLESVYQSLDIEGFVPEESKGLVF